MWSIRILLDSRPAITTEVDTLVSLANILKMNKDTMKTYGVKDDEKVLGVYVSAPNKD